MTSHPRAGVLCALAFLAVGVPAARAAPVQIPLDPHTTQVRYTVYAFGFIPILATYGRFSGALTIDPADRAACAVQLTVDIASLQMADPYRVRQALAPDMLDAARYPTMRYAGTCRQHDVAGTLALHGVSRTLSLSVSRDGDRLIAIGTLRRHDYGIDGLPHLLGQRIRIRLTTTVPAELASKLARPG